MLAALNAQIGGDKIKFTAVKLEPVSSTDQERTLRFTADGALIGDLFVRRETAATLREKHPDSLDRLETLANELATPAGARLVELAQTGDLPADPLALVLLDQSAKAGTAFSVTGQILAARGNEGWKLEIVPGELTPALPLGKPRAHHPENALVASDPAFATTLERLVSARLALAEKLEAAREQLAEQLRHEREARQTALTVALQPGVLFLGQAEPLAGGEPIAGLVLEIATVKAGARQLTALLRNDGGWTDARTFTGSWETDDEFNALALPLSTRASHALADAGPLLSLREGWTIELSLAPDGTLAGLSPSHRYTFQRVASSDLERVRTDLAATHEAAVAATHVGTVYRGTVTPRGGGTETAALLRFTRQENNGARLEAELELVDQPGRSRAFRGFVAANRHRTGDAPIRLASEARRRAPRADPASVTGFAMDLAPALALKGDTLAGADDSFTYTFARLSDEEFGRIAATRRDAQTGLLAAVKRGASYDGTARHRDGFSTPVRLRFTRAEDDGTTEAVLESLKRPGVNVRFVGTADFTARQLQFSRTGGRPDNGKDLRLPCFVQNAKYSLRLALGERTLDGAFEHDTEWTLAFTLAGGAVAAPAEFPAWPKAAGAYALIGDNWRPLPTNNGRSVNSANARLAKVTSRKDDPTAPTKVAELVFDGKDPVPAIPQGAPVALLYVGLVPPIPAATIAQYPDALRDYPAMELAPCRKALVGGKRIADLFRVTPEIAGFQTARTAATLSEPGTDLTLLLANVALPPGNYALLANGAAYEVQVK